MVLYNLLVEWEDGYETLEPLDSVIKDDPICVANYAHENNLLITSGWNCIKRIAINKNRINKMATQENVSSTSQKGPVYNFGIMIPCNVKQAFELDAKNGNTLWKDVMIKEIENIQFYQTFKDMGNVTHVSGYKRALFILYSR
jgi:hypothetical protein